MSNTVTIPGFALFAPIYEPMGTPAARPTDAAEPEPPEQSASEPTLTMTMPEVQALVAAVRADEQALAAKAAQHSRSASPTGNQGRADTSAPNASKGSPWAAWEAEAAAYREAYAAERAAMIAAGTYKSEGLPIRVTLAETGGHAGLAAAAAERKPDRAAAWSNVIDRMKGNGR